MGGGTHFITGPAMRDERCGQPAMLGQDVAGEIAPDMVAAEMIFLFDQHDLQFGPHPRKRERNQPTGKSAAYDCQIAFDIVAGRAVHRFALAQPHCKGKACPV